MPDIHGAREYRLNMGSLDVSSSGGQQIGNHPYSFLAADVLNLIRPLVKEGTLERILQQEHGPTIVTDAVAFVSRNRQSYERLKTDLVGYVEGFTSQQSYHSTTVNEFGQMVQRVLDYIDFLKSVANPQYQRLKQLKIAVVKAALQKIPRVREYFDVSVYRDLLVDAERELRRERWEADQRRVVYQQTL